jgi:aminopeptidase-like protein
MLSIKGSTISVTDILNFLVYSDGSHDVIDIANIIGLPVDGCYSIVDQLLTHDLIEVYQPNAAVV